MYKILIVDDETTERDVISFLLKKYNFPLQITEASNGKEALKQMQKHTFDILFTDIRMPFIDGLELATTIRQENLKIPIIFFSGYDDFDYVKEALSLQVVNYILKPVNPDEFRKTIQQVLLDLDQEKINEKNKKNELELTKNHILYQIINKVNIDYLKNMYPLLDFSFIYNYHRLFLIQFEKDYFGILPSDFINLNPSQNILLFAGEQHRFDWYQHQAELLSKKIKNICKMNCYIAISDPFNTPKELPRAYAQAEQLLEERFFFTNHTLYSSYDSFDSTKSPTQQDINDDMLLKQLQTDIQFRDTYSIRQNIQLLLSVWKSKKTCSTIYIRFITTSLLKILLDGFQEKTSTDFNAMAETIYTARHFCDIEQNIIKLTEELILHLEPSQQSPKHAIHLVKQYIYTHYGDDLCLDLLAEKVYLTPRYLSTMFIQETGCGINKFIKSIRMQKAKELLLNTNMKINDICQKVGYSNVSYFCKSFMENFGTTPEKYRNQSQ